MPWCEDCTKFWSPNSLPETGKCPGCGLQIAEPQELADAGEYRAPWHFKVMIALAAVYLGWRFIQLATWVV
jgi:hypothetical protein